MTPRTVPLVVPAGSARYWSVSLAGRGDHAFRFPLYDVASRVRSTFRAVATEGGAEPGSPRWCAERVRPICAMLGACWWHRDQAIDIAMPGAPHTWSDAQVLDYGGRVADELQEAGYSLLDMIHLFTPTMQEVNRRLDMLQMVTPQADFSQAPEANGMPSP